MLLLCVAQVSLGANITEVRAFYDKAIYSEKEAIKLCANFESSTDIIEQGYVAATIITRAKFVFNPYKKYAFFEQGKLKLEALLAKYPDDIELRYIRYMIQTNIPSFLGYKSAIKSDRVFLTAQVNTLKDQDLKTRITAYLAEKKQ